MTKYIGEAVLMSRTKAKQSQRQLAFAMGVPRTYISKVERGGLVPTLTSLFRIAGGLSVPAWKIVRRAERLQDKNRASDEAAMNRRREIGKSLGTIVEVQRVEG